MSTSKAHVEYDPPMLGVRLALVRESGGYGGGHVAHWPTGITFRTSDEAGATLDDDAWLRLNEDDARAIYEALADYFGHSGHDTRSLRKDYDAERKRVDQFIAHLTGGSR